MSRILPEPLVGQFPPEVVEVYRALRSIPDDDLTVWVSLPLPGCEGRPDFLLVWRDRSAFLVAVSTGTRAELESAAGLSLFQADHRPPGEAEAERLRSFFIRALADTCTEGGSVTGLVLFPHVEQALLDQLPIRPRDVFFLGREFCKSSALADFLARETPKELEESAVAVLRSAFTPESVVPARFQPSRVMERSLEARLTPMLLDFDQEQWAKHRLVLSSEGAAVAEEPVPYGGASLVTGVAGSGKSLVLLFRACTQARLAPRSNSLVLTHNKALKVELESRFGDLGRPANVRWHTFFSWIREMIGRIGPFPEIVQYSQRDECIAAAAKPFWGELQPNQIEFLRDEFDWMQDRDIVEAAAYYAVERTGRGVRLGEAARQKVFATFSAYREILKERGAEDWSGIALAAWQLIRFGKIHPPQFDFIYIDEAQFFAPVWFQIILSARKSAASQILIAADPTQGFLKRRLAWSACGLDMRGRSTRLRRSYRSTREILDFAANFYRSRIADDELPDLNLPGEEELASAVPGSPPVVIRLAARQDETARVASEIQACLAEGLPPESLLIIHAADRGSTALLERFKKSLGCIADAREPSASKQIRFANINAATGLESPVVFLLGAAGFLEAEADLQLKDDARSELLRDNTRRLYMAFTRAGRKLVITWTGLSLPPWLPSGP